MIEDQGETALTDPTFYSALRTSPVWGRRTSAVVPNIEHQSIDDRHLLGRNDLSVAYITHFPNAISKYHRYRIDCIRYFHLFLVQFLLFLYPFASVQFVRSTHVPLQYNSHNYGNPYDPFKTRLIISKIWVSVLPIKAPKSKAHKFEHLT